MGIKQSLSKDQIKQLFMASPHVEWVPFAEEQGWNPTRSRSDFPVSHWIDEKKQILSRAAAESVASLLFTHNHRWHKDVLETLASYPDTASKIKSLLDKKLQTLLDKDINSVSIKELHQLAITLKSLTEAAYKALLIDQWSMKLAETHLREITKSENDEEASKDGIVISIIKEDGTAGAVSTKDIEAMMARYYDQN